MDENLYFCVSSSLSFDSAFEEKQNKTKHTRGRKKNPKIRNVFYAHIAAGTSRSNFLCHILVTVLSNSIGCVWHK